MSFKRQALPLPVPPTFNSKARGSLTSSPVCSLSLSALLKRQPLSHFPLSLFFSLSLPSPPYSLKKLYTQAFSKGVSVCLPLARDPRGIKSPSAAPYGTGLRSPASWMITQCTYEIIIIEIRVIKFSYLYKNLLQRELTLITWEKW